MDLLCVFDQSFQQRRWRVSEILTKFVKDKLGVRPGVISATAEYCAETTSVTVLQCDDFEAQWHSESARTCKYNADHSRSSLLLVTGLELLGEELVQPQHGSIRDHYVSESIDISVNSVGNSDLVETVLDEVAEILRERRRQPMVEAAGRDRLISRRVVAASEASECSALAYGEAEHERSHEDWNLKLPLTLDHAEFLEEHAEELGGKQCSEPTHDSR